MAALKGLVLAMGVALAAPGRAQDTGPEPKPGTKPETLRQLASEGGPPAGAAAGEKPLGWKPSALAGVYAALSSASNVIGQSSGSSQTYGTSLSGSYSFRDEFSEWQNSLAYSGATTRTTNPALVQKARDELALDSLYLYSLPEAPKVGPYAKISARVPLFAGEDARPAPVNYEIARQDGSTESLSSQSSLKLTDAFRPLATRESVGGFWKAIEGDRARLDFRLGAGAEQIAAAGQYALVGSNPDGSVAIKELRDLAQAGVDAAVASSGRIGEKSQWSAGLEALTPLVSSKAAGDPRDPIRLTAVDGFVKITAPLSSWASVSYDYKLSIEPQLLDAAQESHMFTLNLNYALF
jgi:hypothetical protein